MERNIGEIFEYKGEWYQCVEGLYCDDCAFINDNCDYRERITLREKLTKQPTTGFCNSEKRNDRKSVIFKKLKKVGEPYRRWLSPFNNIMVQRYRLYGRNVIMPDEPIMILEPNYKNSIEIQIKQNEDMDENKLNLKPFSLEAAKAGKPVCTRDGRKARIICFDAKCNLPIIALITDAGGDESLARYNSNGRFTNLNESDCDLMMLHEKKEGWVNVYYDNDASSHRGCRFIYDTKEQAVKEAGSAYIDTIKISWSE